MLYQEYINGIYHNIKCTAIYGRNVNTRINSTHYYMKVPFIFVNSSNNIFINGLVPFLNMRIKRNTDNKFSVIFVFQVILHLYYEIFDSQW